jgi:hypothetical protein
VNRTVVAADLRGAYCARAAVWGCYVLGCRPLFGAAAARACCRSFVWVCCCRTQQRVRNCSVCAAETDITEAGVAALAASVHSNYVLRVCYVSEGDGDLSCTGRALWRELACHYRVPHVRLVVRIRVMCQAGRCRAAGARRGEIIAWLCERAPLWVVTHVCSLLRCPAIATAAPLEFA